MKPLAQNLKLETEGLTNEHKGFTVSQNSRMFEILSSNIYKDKVLAVVREYSCNAYDAHIASGNEDKPFDVHLPNEFEPWFSIRDYGTGLSHDDVMNLYTTYGLSTKVNTNDEVGMLGLGSKSAFAYTDQFVVTSYFQGMKRTYSAFLSEEKMPMITMISEEVTTEPNGMDIYLAAKSEDFRTFIDRARDVYFRFPLMPNITGAQCELEKVEYTLEGSYFKLRKPDHDGAYAIQGVVAYPISVNSFGTGVLTPEQKQFLTNVPIDFLFPMGSLDIAASREDLNYNKVTQKNLLDAIIRLVDELPQQFDTLLDHCKTKWEAQVFYNQWRNEQDFITSTILKASGKKIMWNGIEMKRKDALEISTCNVIPQFDPNDPTKKLPDRYEQWAKIVPWEHYELNPNRNEPAPTACMFANFQLSEKSWLIFEDKKYKAPTRAMREVFYPKDVNVTLIRDYKPEHVQMILDQLDGIPAEQVKYLSEFPEPPSPKMKMEIRKVMMADFWSPGGPRVKEINHDINKPTKYLMLYKSELEGVEEKTADSKLAFNMHYASIFGLVDDSVRLLNSSHRSIANRDNWTDYRPEIVGKIKSFAANPMIAKSFKVLWELKDHECFNGIIKLVEKHPELMTPEITKLINYRQQYVRYLNRVLKKDWDMSRITDNYHGYVSFMRVAREHYNISVPEYSVRPDIQNIVNSYTDKYPLLSKLLRSLGYYSAISYEDIRDYILYCNYK